MKVPEYHRVINDRFFGSDRSAGNNGHFRIPHYKIEDYFFICMASNGAGWEHVSTTLQSPKRKVERCPTWEEMCYIKDQFWDTHEYVMQFHPPKEQYVSMHPYCLHLWRPTELSFPVPSPLLVGINTSDETKNKIKKNERQAKRVLD